MKEYIEYLSTLSEKQLVLLLAKQKQAQTAPVAILGCGCRLPGDVNSIEALWQSLLNNEVHIRKYEQGPPGASNRPRWTDSLQAGSNALTCGAYLNHIDQTTNPLNLDEEELLYMDPQQRLLLECTLDALTHAGLERNALKGQKVGIFVGISAAEYLFASVANGLDNQDLSPYMGPGVALSSAPGRIAMLLQSEGPSMSIDTACSSALSALHQAKMALRNGDCDYAIVGASHLLLSPYTAMVFDKANMLSTQGVAKIFDAEADGHVRGEGVGVLLLSNKSAAKKHAIEPLAWLKGSAVNQQGQRADMSISTGTSQREAIIQALNDSQLKVSDIDYVEAHATGSKLGAQVEVENLRVAYHREEPLHIGSAKSSFGHLEAASGIVSVLKAIALVHHRKIPAQTNLHTMSDEILALKGHLKIATDQTDIKKEGQLHCGVSSFGFTGTCAHAIIASGEKESIAGESASLEDKQRFWPTNNHWS